MVSVLCKTAIPCPSQFLLSGECMSDKTHGCAGTRGGDTKDGKTGMDRIGPEKEDGQKRGNDSAVEEEARNGIGEDGEDGEGGEDRSV